MPTANLTGQLTIGPTTDTQPLGSSGCGYGLTIRIDNKAPTKEHSSTTGSVDSPASFVALAMDTNILGRVFYIRTREDGQPGPLDIRLTQLGAGTTVISQVKGLFVVEVDSTEAITLVEVQGVAQFEWVLFGTKT